MTKKKSKSKLGQWKPVFIDEPMEVPANLTYEQRREFAMGQIARLAESLAQKMVDGDPTQDKEHWRRVFADIGMGGDGKVE